MSDTPPTGDALRRALERCSGGPECPCGGTHGGPPRNPTASPLHATAGGNGDSSSETSGDPSPDSGSESETASDASIRYGVPVQDWGDLESLDIGECEHNLMCILRRSWAGRDVYRHYLGCPLEVSKICLRSNWSTVMLLWSRLPAWYCGQTRKREYAW